MNTKTTFLRDPSKFLKDVLLERKSKNPSYSARAFAKNLGLSQAFLSMVINQKRKLSLEQKLKLLAVLGIQEKPAASKMLDQIELTLEHEKILKYWYHFAILELTVTEPLNADAKKISFRLGISEIEASTAIQRLIEFGYLKLNPKNHLIKTKAPFVIDAKKTSRALRAYHQSRLQAANLELEKFDETSVQNRTFQTLFIPTSRERAQSAKKLIDQFQQQLIQYLISDTPTEVFQLSLQIFSAEKNPNPETKNTKEKT
jgi:transcriptional regulator with XRE-family HTH domain